MNLKDMFGRVQSNPDNLHADGSPWLRCPTSQLDTFDGVGAVQPNMNTKIVRGHRPVFPDSGLAVGARPWAGLGPNPGAHASE